MIGSGLIALFVLQGAALTFQPLDGPQLLVLLPVIFIVLHTEHQQ